MTGTNSKPPATFGRIVVVPIVVLVAGYLIGGLIPGVAIAAIFGVAWILYALRR